MDRILASQLLASIEADRLVVFCGAGLSMARPSAVPSAVVLANQCAHKYQMITGEALPAHLSNNLEALVDAFLDEAPKFELLIRKLVDWGIFRRNPNLGHTAIADFLSSRVVDFCVSLNFDTLIEGSATNLGETDFNPALDGVQANVLQPHATLLKLHGCCQTERMRTLWCEKQLTLDVELNRRIQSSRAWLAGTLQNRDILFIGFWTDWRYLNNILESLMPNCARNLVVLVDPLDDADLQAKAPDLWNWASQAVTFARNKQSGSEFLDELRKLWSKQYLERLIEQSKPTYQLKKGRAYTGAGGLFDSKESWELFELRRCAEGLPNNNVPRSKRPTINMNLYGAIMLMLMERGAAFEGPICIFDGLKLRVLNITGDLISRAKARFEDELTPTGVDVVVCVGADDDGGVPSNIARDQSTSTVVRTGTSGEWINHNEAIRRFHL